MGSILSRFRSQHFGFQYEQSAKLPSLFVGGRLALRCQHPPAKGQTRQVAAEKESRGRPFRSSAGGPVSATMGCASSTPAGQELGPLEFNFAPVRWRFASHKRPAAWRCPSTPFATTLRYVFLYTMPFIHCTGRIVEPSRSNQATGRRRGGRDGTGCAATGNQQGSKV